MKNKDQKQAKAKWKPAYVAWREGRPRFVPGPRERSLGFKACNLRHGANGAWYNMDETRKWAEENYKKIEAARNKPEQKRDEREDSVGQLIKDYIASPDFNRLGEKTKRDARTFMNHIIYCKKEDKNSPGIRTIISQCPANFIEPAEVKGFFELLVKERGLAMARAIIMQMSGAFSWARTSAKWRIPQNPCHKLRIPSPPPRVFTWTLPMIKSMVSAADYSGYPEIGDAIYMGLFTAQRLADRLELVDNGLVDGKRAFRQNKTGVVVEIPEMPQLSERLKIARERRAMLPHKIIDNTIIINEHSGRSFSTRHYNTIFNKVKNIALNGIKNEETGEWVLEPAPIKLKDARDQDLRDTAVTWLAIAGCSLLQIHSITGHSIASIQTTIRHYLALDPRLSGYAIDLLKDWIGKEGMQL